MKVLSLLVLSALVATVSAQVTVTCLDGAARQTVIGNSFDRTVSVSAPSDSTGLTVTQTAGSLPDGLSLASDGQISGTPTVAGTFTFTLSASVILADTTPSSGSAECSIQVHSCQGGCTASHGYWKNAGALMIQTDSLTFDFWLGTADGTNSVRVDTLAESSGFLAGKTCPQKGNPLNQLYMQLTAARLNIAFKSSCAFESGIPAAFTRADEIIAAYNCAGIMHKDNKAVASEAADLASFIEGYNVGRVGPGYYQTLLPPCGQTCAEGTLVGEQPIGNCKKQVCGADGAPRQDVDADDKPSNAEREKCNIPSCDAGGNPVWTSRTDKEEHGCGTGKTCWGATTTPGNSVCVCAAGVDAPAANADAPGNCQKAVCNGENGFTTAADDNDLPTPPLLGATSVRPGTVNPCVVGQCNAGVPSVNNLAVLPNSHPDNWFEDAFWAALEGTFYDTVPGDCKYWRCRTLSGTACTAGSATGNCVPFYSTQDEDKPSTHGLTDNKQCTLDGCSQGVPYPPLTGTSCTVEGGGDGECTASGDCEALPP